VGADGSVRSERYLPVGGLARATGSLELGLPFPFLSGEHATFAFADAGRVWSPEPGFEPGDPELALDPWLYSLGAGLQFATIAGPVRIAVGYKLNPTVVDLLSPQTTANALLNGVDLSSLEPDTSRRWHLHIAIGRGM
jgi:outer membrane protein assembly factor BamA